MIRSAVALAAALFAASCAVPSLKLPSGPFGPASDGAEVLTQATQACAAITTLTAEVAVRGSVGGRRLRTRLLVGLAAPESARLEAPAPFGQPLFIFVAHAREATLLLPRDGRVLEHGRPPDVLEALTGLSLGASDLRATLTGCPPKVEPSAVRQMAEQWRVIQGPDEAYLRRERPGDPWRAVAVVHRPATASEWRAEFRDFQGGLPRAVHLVSANRSRFDLTLVLAQVEINTRLEPDVFRVNVPRGVTPITIEELQRTGPLADRGPARSDRGADEPEKP